MLVADFCIAPSSNALDLVESRYYGIVSYYSTCEGPNPITVPITNAAISLKILNASISMLAAPGGDCEGNPYLLDCSTSIEYAYTNLTAVEESAACAPIEKQWKDVFNDAVCRDGYDGMYITWTTQCVVCALVFAVLVFASLAYPYFTTNWKSGVLIRCMYVVLALLIFVYFSLLICDQQLLCNGAVSLAKAEPETNISARIVHELLTQTTVALQPISQFIATNL